jgi:hypothetical protein
VRSVHPIFSHDKKHDYDEFEVQFVALRSWMARKPHYCKQVRNFVASKCAFLVLTQTVLHQEQKSKYNKRRLRLSFFIFLSRETFIILQKYLTREVHDRKVAF